MDQFKVGSMSSKLELTNPWKLIQEFAFDVLFVIGLGDEPVAAKKSNSPFSQTLHVILIGTIRTHSYLHKICGIPNELRAELRAALSHKKAKECAWSSRHNAAHGAPLRNGVRLYTRPKKLHLWPMVKPRALRSCVLCWQQSKNIFNQCWAQSGQKARSRSQDHFELFLFV